MISEWLDREALITVKAYPNPSKTYRETVCVAAVTREEGWIRLYPVRFRAMPIDQRFKKYQLVKIRMEKHRRDKRPESYRLDENSIQLGEVLKTNDRWATRWDWIRPTLSRSMCEILREQRSRKRSLGVFRPKAILDIEIEDESAAWSQKKQGHIDQLMLFDENYNPLEKIPMKFRYSYVCVEDSCRGHCQSIVDWELMELYRRLSKKCSSVEEIKRKIKEKFINEIWSVERDTHLFVGNQQAHPGGFLVLGVFWPPKGTTQKQPSLF